MQRRREKRQGHGKLSIVIVKCSKVGVNLSVRYSERITEITNVSLGMVNVSVHGKTIFRYGHRVVEYATFIKLHCKHFLGMVNVSLDLVNVMGM
jgi:hypothetical protein